MTYQRSQHANGWARIQTHFSKAQRSASAPKQSMPLAPLGPSRSFFPSEDQDCLVFISGSPNYQHSWHLVNTKNYGKARWKERRKAQHPPFSTYLSPIVSYYNNYQIHTISVIFLCLIGFPQYYKPRESRVHAHVVYR